ncbi:MAG TPA: DNA helicase [Aquamicrobium sp.]|nr:DNA helicase [Aquamicrobium sp.]
MAPSVPIRRLKYRAKLLSRDEGIPLHAALDRIAAQEGFPRWSLLVSTARSEPIDYDAGKIFARLVPGDLVLVAARPGQGKTTMGLRIAVEAMRAGRAAMFFSLEYTPRDMLDRFRAIGAAPEAFEGRFVFDNSDGICAGYITGKLADAQPGTLAVIDYLQLLDQRRDTPELGEQVRALSAFARRRGLAAWRIAHDEARRRGLILVFLSQVDRRYDPARKPCPDHGDIRLPNPLDLSLFPKACFLNGGAARFHAAR